MLARWSGWGALAAVFDTSDTRFAAERDVLQQLLDDAEWAAARRTTLNAHYTSAEVIEAVWDLTRDLGFETGDVLEPGCGSGNFIGFAPAGARLTGVELDPTTARIADHLYGGRATIHTAAFERWDPPRGGFDLAIGNVPFADVVPHDPRHNPNRQRLHNYFILKSLQLTRAGGTVVVLTSRYTLDSRNPGARHEIAELADLVGAARLPAGAFKQAAGTDVVTDLLVLRRRPPGAGPAGPAWASTAPIDDHPDDPVWCNELFLDHPELVAGEIQVGRGMYRERELTVAATGTLSDHLHRAFDAIVEQARGNGTTHAPEPAAPAPVSTIDRATPALPLADGSFVTHEAGFGRVQAGRVEPYTPRVAKDAAELRRLIALRDSARAVLAGQLDPDGNALADAQRQLSDHYDAYRRVYGPINRYKQARTGKTDPVTGEETMRRLRPRMGGFRDDPDWPLVAALEIFDDDTQHATPAPIFTQRVISPPSPRLGVDTPAEAIAVCLDESGSVTIDRAAQLLGISTARTRDTLGDLVYDDPATGRLVPATEYLSGNIRHKLREAEAVAPTDPRFERNVAALRTALPRQLEPAEITARLGAPWIPAADVESFCAEVMGAEIEIEFLPTIGRWSTALRVGRRASVALSSEWGTARADAVSLLDATLNQRLHTVTDEADDGKRVRNDAETIAAREKQDAMGERFSTWVWEDPARSKRLADRYNELFASVALPSHDGSHLSLPGLAATFEPRQHQRDAVARILTDGRALLAHAVGAGKTATMVIAAMELGRLGSATKPAVVVPNHMLEQFSREWLQLYPNARVLIADRSKLTAERRKEFVARCATGEWDGVLFTHSSFGRLPLRSETVADYMGRELTRAREALEQSRSGKGLTVKRLERRIAQLEETYQRLLAEDRKDDGVCFEETGLDFVFLDEAHLFKNRRVDSSIDGMAHPGSQRAQDLDAKLWYLRSRHGPRVVTFATATPVANSMAELWVAQTYLQPEVLESLDLAPFDAWAATFGRTVTNLELAPDGSSYRLKTRFARFQNVPELMTLYRQVADVRTNDDIDLPRPDVAGGGAQTVVVEPSEELTALVADLAERAERVRNRAVDPTEDNMLKITGDGRRAALDLRLVGQPPADRGKLDVAAEHIAVIHARTRDLTYLDDTGEPHPRAGSLQLVFCDVSTPSGDGWNAYDALRDLLAARGVPAGAVRFIHEAGTDEAKAKLFQACRDGRVAVLVGSTDKMGIGTNVQARAIALHHLDCPWRPADIEQRDGRIVRQGNQNPEVEIYRYVTEGSFDIYMWQTLERKASFIAQVTRGDLPDRDVDDIGDQALTYAEVKALATGNALIVEKAGVDNDIARLRRLERSHQDDQHRLRRTLDTARHRAANATRRADTIEAAIANRQDTSGDRFNMVLTGSRYDKRADAGVVLRHVLGEVIASTPQGCAAEATRVGEFAGFSLSVRGDSRIGDEIHVDLEEGLVAFTLTASEVANADPVGLIRRLERRVTGLDDDLTRARTDAENASAEAERARARLGRPFEHADELSGLVRRQAEITDALNPTDGEAGAATPEPSPVPPAGPRGPGLV